MKTILTALFAALLCATVYGQSSGLCTIPGSEGPCGVEPFLYGQVKDDPHAFTCHKFTKASYTGKCVGGKLEGPALLKGLGSGRGASFDTRHIAVFQKGMIKTPHIQYSSHEIFLGMNGGFSGCVHYAGFYDFRNTHEHCIKVKRSMGEHLLDKTTAQAVRSGTFDLSTVSIGGASISGLSGSTGTRGNARVPEPTIGSGLDDPKVSGRGARP